MNKYKYLKVIQQWFHASHGWEDQAEYEPPYEYLDHDYKEYVLMGYPVRIINRRELNDQSATT